MSLFLVGEDTVMSVKMSVNKNEANIIG